MAKHTATFAGKSFSRSSARTYLFAVVGETVPELLAQHCERRAAYCEDQIVEHSAVIASGEKGLAAFAAKWSFVKNAAEARSWLEKEIENDYRRIEDHRADAAAERAKAPVPVQFSWHQSAANAQAGLRKAMTYEVYTSRTIVPVTRTLTRKEIAAAAAK